MIIKQKSCRRMILLIHWFDCFTNSFPLGAIEINWIRLYEIGWLLIYSGAHTYTLSSKEGCNWSRNLLQPSLLSSLMFYPTTLESARDCLLQENLVDIQVFLLAVRCYILKVISTSHFFMYEEIRILSSKIVSKRNYRFS